MSAPFFFGECCDIKNDPTFAAAAKAIRLQHVVIAGDYSLTDEPDHGIDEPKFLADVEQSVKQNTWFYADIERYPASGSQSEVDATVARIKGVSARARKQFPALKLTIPIIPQTDFDPSGRFANQLAETHARNLAIADVALAVDGYSPQCYVFDTDPPEQREALLLMRVAQAVREVYTAFDPSKPTFPVLSPMMVATQQYPAGYDFNKLLLPHDVFGRILDGVRIMLGVAGVWIWYADGVPVGSPPLMPFGQMAAYQALKEFAGSLQTPIW